MSAPAPTPRAPLPLDLSPEEKQLLEFLSEPRTHQDLSDEFDIPTHQLNILLSAMEIKGIIKEELGEIRKTF